MIRLLLLTAWFAALIGGWVSISQRTYESARASYRLVEPPPLSQLDRRILDIVTLGFKGVYDDFLSIWSIQFLADESVKSQDPELVFAAMKAITRQRPQLESVYLLSCFVFTFDLQKPEYCKDLIIDGMAALPDSWRLPMTQGFIYTSRMQDPANGAAFYALAASRPGAPAYLKSLSQRLAENNRLSIEDLEGSINQIFSGDGIESRLGDFMNEMMQKKQHKEGGGGN